MEEKREQPTVEPAIVLDKTDDLGAVSDVGSQNDLGKFKNAKALLDAYNNLQSEFTRKCQLLKELQKDKIDEEKVSNDENIEKNLENSIKNQENLLKNENNEENHAEVIDSKIETSQEKDNVELGDDQDNTQALSQFLLENHEAVEYAEEIKKYLQSNSKNKNPFENAWANVILSHIKTNNSSDPMIDQYILSNEKVKNKIIENYLNELTNQKSPMIMSSQGGERVSGVFPDSPKTLAEAKKIVNNMFS